MTTIKLDRGSEPVTLRLEPHTFQGGADGTVDLVSTVGGQSIRLLWIDPDGSVWRYTTHETETLRGWGFEVNETCGFGSVSFEPQQNEEA